MIKLYDSAFSPFARKVRMTLEYKALNYEVVDGLLKSNHAALKDVNGRIEVPVLVDDGIVVVNSSDIVAYLDYRYPSKTVYPDDPAARVHARAWERIADTFVDPILVDISYWKWAERSDKMPDGLIEAARADLRIVYDALNEELAERQFVSGPLSIADIALFPHMSSARGMGAEFSTLRSPQPRALAQGSPCAAYLCSRPQAGESLCRQHEGRGHREATYFLARRSYRVGVGSRLSRVVFQ